MRIIRTKAHLDAFLRSLERRAQGADEDVVSAVGEILDSVRKGGDRALMGLTKKFDGHTRIRLTEKEIASHAERADGLLVKALRFSARRIRAFHKRQKERLGSWSFDEDGIRLGQIARPLRRVGVYVPGGKAAYPSTVLMNVIPAQVAGVEEIAVAVPTPGGAVNPAVMAAIRMLGVREVYSIGGAQAVAAFAYGTKTIKRVDKITGPGNIYVATAKKMVFGLVDIDMIAGPSEILIIADRTANASFIAADLLSQAEHDELASSVCVTDSEDLAHEVAKEVKTQLRALNARTAIASVSLKKYGAVIVAKDLGEAVEIANRIAPEHLEIMTKNPGRLVKGLRNAGAVFLGPWSPEPVGDYSAGPNHTLPTGGTARFSSPLGVYDFMKHTSYLRLSKRGFMRLAPWVEKIADAEGLCAHRDSISIRRRKN
jgi:histidinol dehydrogenase